MATLKYWSEASSVYILMAERYKVSSTLQDGGWLYWPCNIQIPDTEAHTAHAQLRSILRLPALEAGGGGGRQLHQPRSSNKLSTLIIIILNPPASSWQCWSLGFRKGVKEVNASLNYKCSLDGSDSLRFTSA